LDRLGDQVEYSAFMLFNHVETLRKQGFINKLTVFDVSHMGGLVGQSYYEGAYDLKPDEALIVEAKVPQGCTYWSIILTNDISLQHAPVVHKLSVRLVSRTAPRKPCLVA
jgi:hypothetical protein